MKSLVDAARTRPLDAIRCLEEQERLQTSMVEPVILAKKKCALENCKNVSLPCMPTCVRHILYCEKQTLFEQCRVRESNDVQCDKPVLNIRYNYPVCSLHSKSNFTLPDFSREDILYEDVRNKNTSSSSDIYKIDFDFTNANATLTKPSVVTSSKLDAIKKKNNTVASGSKTNSTVRVTPCVPDKVEKIEKKFEKPDVKYTKNGELKRKPSVIASNVILRKEEPKPNQTVPAENQNLLRDWVNLSDNQLVDAKTLENTLQNEFVNGFDINSSTIQSQIQDIINSESTLSTEMLMGTHEIPNYIQVEEMIEEVEITDEGELNGPELVHSEDLNAVLKQLPPEAFNELFSDKSDSHWGETQALERVIEEMDVRKCPLIDPSLLLEDIEPTSYASYSDNFDGNTLAENVESRFSNLTPENCSQSQS